MPRPARRAKSRRAGYGEHHIHHLLRGVYLCPGHGFTTLGRSLSGDFTDYDALRKGWDDLRQELLPAFIAENPGHRPYAWWCFDSPERLQRTDGVQHPFDNRLRKAHVEEVAKQNPRFREVAYQLFYGRPRALIVRDDFEAKYESELEYLDRLGLLTDQERREIYA